MPTRSPMFLLLLAALAFGAAASATSPVLGQAILSPWQVVEEGFTGQRGGLRHYLGRRTVRVDVDVLRTQTRPGDRIDLDLLPGVRVQGELDRVSDDPFNGYVWRGRVVGEPSSMITLVVEPDGIAGTINYSGGALQIRYIGDGLSAVLESDPGRPRGDDVRLAPVRTTSSRPEKAVGAPATTLDILGLFTPVPMGQVGGKRAIVADFKTAVANMQTALDNSGIGAQVRLVKIAKLPYDKGGTDPEFFHAALQDVTNTGDGQLDKAHTLRDKFGADIVALALEINETLCGVGWLVGSGSGVAPSDEASAFNVSSVDCLAGFGGLTVAHESGHNMGLNHDLENARLSSAGGAYSYSYGFRVPGLFRTLMAYPCELQGLAACPERPVFSTPLVAYNGKPAGVPDLADNTRSIVNGLPVITGWRACKKQC